MQFEYIAIILLTVIVIIVGVSIVSFFGQSFQSSIPIQVRGVYDRFVSVLLQRSPYNVCESYDGQKLSIQDFQVLLQAAYNGQCGSSHTHVTMSFSASTADMKRIASLSGIANNGALIFYNISQGQPLGIGAIIVAGDTGYYPLKLDDKIEVWYAGQPKGDLFIKVTEKGCDPYDEVCDASCASKGICDPVCDNGKQYNIPCNLACIDIDQDGIINQTDANARIVAGKCNPDCFSNFTNPSRAYDPGCIYKKITNPNYGTQFAGICDPNSNGVSDGLCDPDCAASKNICDPDCNGTVSYPGNPQGIYDQKCYVCDGTCNGYCSPACDKNAFPGDPGFDPDCYRQLNASYFCSGDGLCDTGRGENCANSADCPRAGITCSNLGGSCCPSASNADVYGCSNTTNVPVGGLCTCGTQCALNLTCDKTSHCCPSGLTWNGTACSSTCPQRIDKATCKTSQPWTPQSIRLAYDIEPFLKAGFDGSGQTIVIVDACGDSSIVSDVNAFNQKFGLPPINLNVIGQQGTCSGRDASDWAGETALDVEWAHAIAPGARIYLIVVSASESSLASGVEYAVNNLPNSIVSMSFADSADLNRYQAAFNSGNQKGITFIAADGDFCSYNKYQPSIGSVSYPAGFSNVLAISGTQNLAVNNNCQYVSETVWNCAGGWGTGGNPSDQSEPSYQQGINAIRDGKRGYGDVALVSGDALPIIFQGQWAGIGGTSDAAPQWAGIIAVLRSAGVKNLQGNINPIIYQIGKDSNLYKKAFHDITSGSNGDFSALQGWDYPTGFGTPDVVGICEALQQ